jgi:type I restriction enzyme S subunit
MFGETFEKTEALKAQYQQSLTELENLYGSLSQKAFKGELIQNKNHG